MKANAEGKYDAPQHAGYLWLAFCTVGMVSSLTLYGIMLEYTTSGGRKLHEISFLFVTCGIYTVTAYTARHFLKERKTRIPKVNMLMLSLSSVLSTFTSVRSLRYVIYPVQVLAKSCKPVPVLLFGVLMGKRYPPKKYVNVAIITLGVGLFMGGGSSGHTGGSDTTYIGAAMLFVSLCFDGATGAYEDKLMSMDRVEPFDLMFNIQIGKTVLAFVALVALNQLDEFFAMVHDTGLVLVLLGLTGALGQVFVFLTINKFGALNCSIIGLARKVLSLLLSFIIYSHDLNALQIVGVVLAISAMVANFRQKGGKHKEHGEAKQPEVAEEEKPLLHEGDEEDPDPNAPPSRS